MRYLHAACLLVVLVTSVRANARPHIVIIVADDLGWNDVGFHGNNMISTPNIDALAYSGVILNNYYVLPLGGPSRTALFTGKHPIHTGMYHKALQNNEPWGLDLSERLLPEYIKDLGYKTHLVGKWHLGHFKKEYTPTYRGFDTFFGYLGARLDYYTHTSIKNDKYIGYDLRRGENVTFEGEGEYATSLFNREATNIIRNHNSFEGPMFLCLSHLAVHTGNKNQSLQAPEEYIRRFEHINGTRRRTFAAMLSVLDDGVGDVVTALEEKGMLENTIIVFTTDNGGAAGGFDNNVGSNWPLKGTKDTVWEGGIRGASFVWSPFVEGRVSSQLSHIQDWLPTLLTAATRDTSLNTSDVTSMPDYSMLDTTTDMESITSPDNVPDENITEKDENMERTTVASSLDDISSPKVNINSKNWTLVLHEIELNETENTKEFDGHDIWSALMDREVDTYEELLLALDPLRSIAALRLGKWKFLQGNTWGGRFDRVIGYSGRSGREYDISAVETSVAAKILAKISRPLPPTSTLLTLREQATIKCSKVKKRGLEPCKPEKGKFCLFDLSKDPCETNNVAYANVRVEAVMRALLSKYKTSVVKPRNQPRDPASNPKFWNNTWTNWQDFPRHVHDIVIPTKI